MTRDAKMLVMSAGVILTSVGLLVVRELGLAESATGRWLAVSIIALVLLALALVLWKRA